MTAVSASMSSEHWRTMQRPVDFIGIGADLPFPASEHAKQLSGNPRVAIRGLPFSTSSSTASLTELDAVDREQQKNRVYSGHFMSSHIHDDDKGPCTKPLEGMTDEEYQMFSMDESSRAPHTSHPKDDAYGITSLLQNMTLSKRTKLTTPNWNNFKGLQLRCSVKVRLNNLLWRVWHMQYIKQQHPLMAPFANEGNRFETRKTSETPVADWACWQRRHNMIAIEYRRCRRFYRERATGLDFGNLTDEMITDGSDIMGIDISIFVDLLNSPAHREPTASEHSISIPAEPVMKKPTTRDKTYRLMSDLRKLIPRPHPTKRFCQRAVLEGTVQHIMRLKQERKEMQAETDALKLQIKSLYHTKNVYMQQPLSGIPVGDRVKKERMKAMLDKYTKTRAGENWKYCMFSLIIRPLLDSYTSSVRSGTVDEMSHEVARWATEQCTLAELRPLVWDSLVKICLNTSIHTDSSQLPGEVYWITMTSEGSGSSPMDCGYGNPVDSSDS